ncbi:hypothetical protein CTEN210_03733 [Chaetoceros tenuissimus]|uniref:5'-nucleotidase n=1 Tax=Chaetoceros tenuissimus TaxID=426638 RepID=A0AAD3CKC4_9STRA|nr:hypothetical protein CTEN210_03733 [Chaetoceros tenuissimus]
MIFPLLALASVVGFTQADTHLTLLHINDHHSHLTESSAGYLNIYASDIPSDVTDMHGGTTYLRAYYGGFPRVITAMNELKASAEANGRDVLKLHAGDAITGTTYFTLFEGDADAKLMNHACFDVFTPGNHEFDKGDAGLAKFLKAMKAAGEVSSTCPTMPAVLNANVVPHPASALLASDVPVIESSKVFTMTNNEKVAVIGINIAQKTMQSSQPDAGTILRDEKEAAQEEIDTLKAQGVNMIILVTHIGYDNDQNWMATLDGVDVVVGGDSHSLLGDENAGIFGSTRGPYATVIERDDGSKVCVVQAWDYSKVVGNLHVDFDGNGNVISCEGNPVFPLNPDKVTVRDANPRYDLPAEDATKVIDSLIARSNGQAVPYPEDNAAVADLAVFSAEVDVLSKTVVATSSANIGLEAGGYESGACDLVAQGFLLNPLSTADVAIQNRGGCRSSIEEGDFTVNDAYTLLPFSNTMVYLEMTGQQIHNVLEDAVDFYLDPAGSWGAYPRASGLRFDVNEAATKGRRITNLEVNARLAGSFQPIDMTKTYSVVTNNFIATPRDGYYEFGNIADELKVDSYVEYAQSFIEYAQDVGTLEKVSDENASTQVWADTTESPTASPTTSAASGMTSTIKPLTVVAAIGMLSFFAM